MYRTNRNLAFLLAVLIIVVAFVLAVPVFHSLLWLIVLFLLFLLLL
jgi:hypothetical protein